MQDSKLLIGNCREEKFKWGNFTRMVKVKFVNRRSIR